MDAREPGVPVRPGHDGPSTNDPADPRLGELVEGLRAALEHLDLTTTRRQLALLELHAERTDADRGPGRATFYARACRTMFALTEGDLVGAARMTDEAEHIGVAAALAETGPVVRALRNDRARQLGDREGMARGAAACESYAEAHDPSSVAAVVARSEAAVLWLDSGGTARAAALVDRLAGQVEGLGDDVLPLVASRLCEAAVGSGRRVVAARCARLLQPFAHHAVVSPDATSFGGVVDDFLALATGDRDSATRARIAYEQLGASWWARRRALDLRPSTSLPRVLHLHPSHRATTGTEWCVGEDGHTHLVTAMPGLEHLRALLHHPGRDLNPADLGAGNAPGDPRQRIMVRQAIAMALSRLDMVDPGLAEELRATVRTGLTCRYDPDPLQPTAWHLEADVAHTTIGR